MALPVESKVRTVAFVVAALALSLVAWAFVGEVNPLAGTWEADRVFEDGVEVPSKEGFIFMDVSRGYATIELSRFCGEQPRHIFAEGDIVQNGDVLALYEEGLLGRRLSTSPSAELVRLPEGRLSYEYSLGDGKVARLEFVRVRNRSTILDLFGWE